MSEIYCADSRCKYNKNDKCMAKEINMSSLSIMTMWEGRQDLLRCNTFEKSEDYKKIEDFWDNILHKEGRKDEQEN